MERALISGKWKVFSEKTGMTGRLLIESLLTECHVAARDWCGAPCARGLVRVRVWTEPTALAVDKLRNPKGYLISAIY